MDIFGSSLFWLLQYYCQRHLKEPLSSHYWTVSRVTLAPCPMAECFLLSGIYNRALPYLSSIIFLEFILILIVLAEKWTFLFFFLGGVEITEPKATNLRSAFHYWMAYWNKILTVPIYFWAFAFTVPSVFGCSSPRFPYGYLTYFKSLPPLLLSPSICSDLFFFLALIISHRSYMNLLYFYFIKF